MLGARVRGCHTFLSFTCESHHLHLPTHTHTYRLGTKHTHHPDPCTRTPASHLLVTVVSESVKQTLDGGPVLHYSRLLDAAHKGLPRQAAPWELKLLDVVVRLDGNSLVVGLHLTRGNRELIT